MKRKYNKKFDACASNKVRLFEFVNKIFTCIQNFMHSRYGI